MCVHSARGFSFFDYPLLKSSQEITQSMDVQQFPNLGFHSSTETEQISLTSNAFNVGICIQASSFQIEQLIDMCCADLSLASDVLDTFCVQGRERLDSLDRRIEQGDFYIAVVDSVCHCSLQHLIMLFIMLN